MLPIQPMLVEKSSGQSFVTEHSMWQSAVGGVALGHLRHRTALLEYDSSIAEPQASRIKSTVEESLSELSRSMVSEKVIRNVP